MERNELHLHIAEAFADDSFLRRLDRSRSDMTRLFATVDWNRLVYPLLPLEQRLTCAQALTAFRPLLDAITPIVEGLEKEYAKREAACAEIDEKIRAIVLRP